MIDYMVVELACRDWVVFRTREEAETYIEQCLRNYPEEDRNGYCVFERRRLD